MPTRDELKAKLRAKLRGAKEPKANPNDLLALADDAESMRLMCNLLKDPSKMNRVISSMKAPSRTEDEEEEAPPSN